MAAVKTKRKLANQKAIIAHYLFTVTSFEVFFVMFSARLNTYNSKVYMVFFVTKNG